MLESAANLAIKPPSPQATMDATPSAHLETPAATMTAIMTTVQGSSTTSSTHDLQPGEKRKIDSEAGTLTFRHQFLNIMC